MPLSRRDRALWGLNSAKCYISVFILAFPLRTGLGIWGFKPSSHAYLTFGSSRVFPQKNRKKGHQKNKPLSLYLGLCSDLFIHFCGTISSFCQPLSPLFHTCTVLSWRTEVWCASLLCRKTHSFFFCSGTQSYRLVLMHFSLWEQHAKNSG